MSWTEWFNTAAGATSLMGLIVGAIMGFVAWRIRKATGKLIAQSARNTQQILERMNERTQQTIARMNRRAEGRRC